MSELPNINKRIRKTFGKIHKIIEIPDLIGMQKRSYERFLQLGVPEEKKENIGLQAVFKSVFPIKDYTGTSSLEFVSYRIDEAKQSVEECIYRGMTYEISVRIVVRLVVYDLDKDTGVSNIRDIKEQEIYFGTLPFMTDKGTYVVNGTERVVVSQLHRSSGVFFDHDKGKTHSSGKIIYSSRIIPVRGSWIDIEIDHKNIVYIRIDRRRKFPITTLFKAFGFSVEDILTYYYDTEKIIIHGNEFFKEFNEKFLKGQRSSCDIFNPTTGELILNNGRVFTKKAIRLMKEANISMIPVEKEELLDRIILHDIYDKEQNQIIFKSNDVIDLEVLEKICENGIDSFELIFIDPAHNSASIRNTLMVDKVENKFEAIIDIYRRLRPGNPATAEVAQEFIDHLFFKLVYYELSNVGRIKINHRLNIDTPANLTVLRKEDILLTTKTLVELRDTQGEVDDIDHLGNRRIRAVGELIENQYRIGLVRMERAIKERMSLQEVDALMPHDLVNPKPVSAVVKEFFGTSQLSQFLDQTNPLTEITHKRRLSALGPGGLTRERAGFEVRDVHPSHYGRVCPIETPEGPNIGLIVSLSTYAYVNDYGFIETPYRVVKDSHVTKKVRFLSAFEEQDLPIAQANAPLSKNNKFLNKLVTSRVKGELTMIDRDKIKLMDVSPNQLVSVSASLIPFLENDDANRALMGSNMQRQSVPLLYRNAPLVGTGIEDVVARDSGVAVIAQDDCVVSAVESSNVVVRNDNAKEFITVYKLAKYLRSNQSTYFNQVPIVKEGQRVKKGEVIADGPATEMGELALGKNITVAFMPWGGYNFEDSILVSESLVKDGVFTSIHIEEFEVVARDTKLGREEITPDIPNVGEESLKDLDESGIIRLGAEVKPSYILVGKVTPKGETQLSPEEKLLRAIFGEKAGDVKDTSLRVPPGIEGIVIDVKVFSRRGVEKDLRTKKIEEVEKERLKRIFDIELKEINRYARVKLEELLIGQETSLDLKKAKKLLIAKDTKIEKEALNDFSISSLEGIILKNSEVTDKVSEIIEKYKTQRKEREDLYEKKLASFDKGDDLPPGVIKMVKVYVAMKRKLSVGDKMAGRHGNKGVVSRTLPQEDMPYFEDGSTVDMVLNPLGVPSRMNVGQILEIHLGLAAKKLGQQLENLLQEKNYNDIREKFKKIFNDKVLDDSITNMPESELSEFVKKYTDGIYISTPVFDGAKESEIKDLLQEAGVSKTGQVKLFDGRTGKVFDNPVTVGVMYMLKLHHLVDDKIHARSIGPYSLVTQQPLGGKAQFGGQRLGEMEVWAMEAYGAAHALQEFITVKSDDMAGRTRMYEKIVKGQNVLEPGLPESFNVLTKELQSLGIDIQLMEKKSRKEIN